MVGQLADEAKNSCDHSKEGKIERVLKEQREREETESKDVRIPSCKDVTRLHW